MSTALTTIDITVQDITGEPRVLDTDLGKALGMERPTNIRAMIRDHREALETFGSLHAENANPGPQGGRTTTAYRLNEEQATFVTMHLRTARAQAVKVQLVRVFTAWRRGQLQPTQPSLPDFSNPVAAARAWADAKERELVAVAQVHWVQKRTVWTTWGERI